MAGIRKGTPKGEGAATAEAATAAAAATLTQTGKLPGSPLRQQLSNRPHLILQGPVATGSQLARTAEL